MASEEAGNASEHDQVESLIDDLIRDILGNGGQAERSGFRGRGGMTAMIETAFASGAGATSRTSTIERLLLAQALASALADALAPALADALAPEIMKVLEHHNDSSQGGTQKVPTARQGKEEQKKS